ncbi:MAG: TspO/MBR family protein [Patescibacteria group bacterium]|jgi:tryptophan-rich sensory protein
MKVKPIKLSAAILMSLAAGAIGSAFTFTGIDSWYQYLNKPSFNPPSWIFGPVWTTLYILMGIALYLIWQEGLKKAFVKNSFILFIVNLVLNSLWSITFFGLQNPALAFLVIVLLWITILVLIIRFYRINKLASYLLIPYLLWVSFASVLNFSIWQLN